MNSEINTEPNRSGDRWPTTRRMLGHDLASLITIVSLVGFIKSKGNGFFKSGGHHKLRKLINLIMKIIFSVILKFCNFMPYLMDIGLIFVKLTDPQC